MNERPCYARRMKILLAAAFATATLLQGSPAPAAQGYEIVYGTGYPVDVRGGPFDSLNECYRFMNSNGWYWPYHCVGVNY